MRFGYDSTTLRPTVAFCLCDNSHSINSVIEHFLKVFASICADSHHYTSILLSKSGHTNRSLIVDRLLIHRTLTSDD